MKPSVSADGEIVDMNSAFITYNYHPCNIKNLGGNSLSSSQLEQIEKKRVELKNELQYIEQKERTLGESIRILEEKLAIRELEDRVKLKRQAMERLASRKRDLERRLSEPQPKPQPSQTPHKPPQTPTPQVAQKVTEPQKNESMEVTVNAAHSDNKQPIRVAAPTHQQSKKPEQPKKKKKKEKQKRKWF